MSGAKRTQCSSVRRDEGMRAPLKDAPYAVSLRISWLSSAGEATAGKYE